MILAKSNYTSVPQTASPLPENTRKAAHDMNTVPIHDAIQADQEHILHQLKTYNSTQIPPDLGVSFCHLNRCIKDREEVVGGILSMVYWQVLAVEILWVDERYRHRGYATALLTDLEQTAREMGCKLAQLDTFDFQARGLYEKLGYTVFGTLENCPEGHCRYYMSKKLV